MKRKLNIENTFIQKFFFLLILIVCMVIFWANVNVFMDDVFIYLRVARNITNGTGPLLNTGDNHFPVTSPLWVFILAFFSKVFSFIDLVMLSKILFILFLYFFRADYLAFFVFRPYFGAWASLSPFPVFFNHITVTSTGGEIAIVYFSIFGILWAYNNKKNLLLTGLFAGIAYLARGELALLLIPIGFHYIFCALKNKTSLKEVSSSLGKIVLGFLSITLIWHFYYALQFESLFPNTLKTKIVQGKSGMWNLYYRFGRLHTLSILNGHYYLLLFMGFGLIAMRSISFSLLTFIVMHYYIYKYLTIPHYNWYYYDFYLLIPISILFGIPAFFNFLKDRFEIIKSRYPKLLKLSIPFPKILALAVVLMVTGTLCITTEINELGKFHDNNRLNKYLRVVNWIKPELKKGDVILAHEIGIIGYFLEDCIIRDLNGIASPDVTLENINDLGYFVTVYLPRFIFFPMWLPQKNSLKYIASKNNLLIYELGYSEKRNDTIMESVFVFKKSVPSRPYIRTLEKIRKNAKYYPGTEYGIVRLGDRFVLSASAPFMSRIKLPAKISGILTSFGFLNQKISKNKDHAGIHFKIFGVKDGKKTLLYHKFMEPGNNYNIQNRHLASLQFKGHLFDSLALIIESTTSSDSIIKGPYWGPLRFNRN